ncbi:MAG: hypothetical protein ACRETU_08785 [Steroidobacterales bacterium]
MRAAASCRSRQATDRRRWLTGGALAGCTATMLAFVLGTAALDWRANKDLAVEAVATHIRPTLNNHVVEVGAFALGDTGGSRIQCRPGNRLGDGLDGGIRRQRRPSA